MKDVVSEDGWKSLVEEMDCEVEVVWSGGLSKKERRKESGREGIFIPLWSVALKRGSRIS